MFICEISDSFIMALVLSKIKISGGFSLNGFRSDSKTLSTLTIERTNWFLISLERDGENVRKPQAKEGFLNVYLVLSF